MVDREAYICAALRTPVGKHGGALARVRADDLAAVPIKAVVERTGIDPRAIDDVILGCTNQAGEDNRNVARMALRLAGLPVEVPGQTVNRLCGSGLQAAASAAQAIKAGEGEVFIAGGVENMSRAPYVMLKPGESWSRRPPEVADTTVGWRFANPRLSTEWTISLGETAEVVAERYKIGRAEQDAFAVESQRRAERALSDCVFTDELVPVPLADGSSFAKDEYPRSGTTLELVAKLRPAFRQGGTVTAASSSGVDDGAAALLRTGVQGVTSGTDADDSRTRLTPYEVSLRCMYDVHRRGPGDRHGGGAGVMAAYDRVLVDIAEGIGTLTLSRPEKLNAFDREMCRDLIDALRMLSGSEQVRVILLTGAGRGFCAGADLGTLAEGAAELVGAGREVPVLIRTAPQPVLAAVNGAAAGGGANLALACDYRLAADTAAIGQVFHNLGLAPDWGGTYFLPRLTHTSTALELVWSARMVPAAEAERLGVVAPGLPRRELASPARKHAAHWA